MTYEQPSPQPKPSKRKKTAHSRRVAAADIARDRPTKASEANGESEAFAPAWPTNFHKGLPHDEYGIVEPIAFRAFVAALTGASQADGGGVIQPTDQGAPYPIDPVRFNVPLGPGDRSQIQTTSDNTGQALPHLPASVAGAPAGAYWPNGYATGLSDNPFKDPTITPEKTFHCKVELGPEGQKSFELPAVRNWESPRAGHTYTIQGPDPAAVGLFPAPTLGSSELCAEMAEVYAMALLRDAPFDKINNGTAVLAESNGTTSKDLVDAFNAYLPWFNDAKTNLVTPSYGNVSLTPQEVRRRCARWIDPDGSVPFRKFDPASPDAPKDPDGKPIHKQLDARYLFRGSVPGAKSGPYISQFLLQGNTGGGASGKGDFDGGYVSYGLQRVDQRVRAHLPQVDYMTHWDCWLDVQNGADVGRAVLYISDFEKMPATKDQNKAGQDPKAADEAYRFITTPRDLASFVHFDQLYQAYLNAGLFLLAADFRVLPGNERFYGKLVAKNENPPKLSDPADRYDSGLPTGAHHPTRGSFATFGAAHVLSLVTEVASRAIRCVRRQKFQVHLRGRPEALGGVLTLAANRQEGRLGTSGDLAVKMAEELGDIMLAGESLLKIVDKHNKAQNEALSQNQDPAGRGYDGFAHKIRPSTSTAFGASLAKGKNYLLPMAFPEGSPMHASYGAGHATVAGACVTVLKAIFEMFEDPRMGENFSETVSMRNPLHKDYAKLPGAAEIGLKGEYWKELKLDSLGMGTVYVGNGHELKGDTGFKPKDLSIQGELNKLAANISIGRNMAGVHYYTDYYDSLRLGERIAVGILQEQMLTYSEPVTMRLNGFDGERIVIATTGEATPEAAEVHIFNKVDGRWKSGNFDAWWTRNL